MKHLIEQSMNTNSIVHAKWTKESEDFLLSTCTDFFIKEDVHEFYGTSNFKTWRVHLHQPSKEKVGD